MWLFGRAIWLFLFGKRGVNSLWCLVCWCGFLKVSWLICLWTWARSHHVWQAFGAGREEEVWWRAGILSVTLGWWDPSLCVPTGSHVWTMCGITVGRGWSSGVMGSSTALVSPELIIPSAMVWGATQCSVCAQLLSRVRLLPTPWTVALGASLSMGFPR